MRPVREITAKEENFHTEEFAPGLHRIRRKSIEPEPVGTYVALAFRVTGYDKDCDGSLMVRLEHVNKNGETSGFTVDCIGLYPDSEVVLKHPSELHDLASISEITDSVVG